MERLTYWNKEYNCWSYHGPSGNAAIRLAAYEDTGLEPEEVEVQSIALAQCKPYVDAICDEHGKMLINLIRLAELAQAEKDGRLVVLPCKVGDTVWTNIAIVGDRYKSADRPYPVQVVFVGMGKDDRFFHVQYESGTVFPFDHEKFGKTVFLTLKEAEAALKKREADNEAD